MEKCDKELPLWNGNNDNIVSNDGETFLYKTANNRIISTSIIPPNAPMTRPRRKKHSGVMYNPIVDITFHTEC